MENRFALRIQTRMSAEDLDARLSEFCRGPVSINFDGMIESNGETLKIVVLSFSTPQDRQSFRASFKRAARLDPDILL